MAHKVKRIVEYHPANEFGVIEEENRITYGPRQLFRVVLEQVNIVRTALAIGEGKLPKLPQGIPGDPQHCVLAAALSNGWVPNVGEEEITLRHPTEGIDWSALKDALESYGFQGVLLGSAGRPSRPLKNRSISFDTPAAMSQLIRSFDEGDLPFLLSAKGRKIVAEYKGWGLGT
jgi:hypothetical protein